MWMVCVGNMSEQPEQKLVHSVLAPVLFQCLHFIQLFHYVQAFTFF